MERRRIGSLDVSAVGLGCMNLSTGYGPVDPATGAATGAALLNEALDLGCTFLDTATMYADGANESLVGAALGHRRSEYVLASKCGLTPAGIDARPATLAGQIDASLARLGTDVVDLYYLHRPDPAVPIEDSVGALARMVEAGKVREIGLSEVSSATLRRAHAVHPIAAVQSEYSLWTRTPEAAMLDACDELGATFVPFSPLGRQFLTGRAKSVDHLPADDLRATIARPRFEPGAFARNAALLEPLGAIAERLGCTRAQLALAWLLHARGGRLVPIPGTKRPEWLRENLAAADVALDARTFAEIDASIDDEKVEGARYTPDRMAASDAERDRRQGAGRGIVRAAATGRTGEGPR